MVIVQAGTLRDLPDIRDLLERHRPPLDDVDEHVGTMAVAGDDARVVGTAALELYADGALLRSVAVDPAARGRGVGQRLTEAALQMAQQRGADTVFLLTTTAE